MSGPTTLFEKVWSRHAVVEPGEEGMPTVLYVDLHLIHEVTSPQAFSELEKRGLSVRRPGQTVGTMDHSTPTEPGISMNQLRVLDPMGAGQLERLRENCLRHGISLHELGSAGNGIVHVMGPEQGLTQPGMTVVCGDSHTSTHGAFGALAFGIGTTEVGYVLATQALLMQKPRTMEVQTVGRLGEGLTGKDLILGIITSVGVDGGTGHVMEYTGEAIEALDMEGRMTVCNMSIEAGSRAGMIAPDETTFEYLKGRPFAPKGEAWDEALEDWATLKTDAGAGYHRSVTLDASSLAPMVTWGTNPGMAVPVTGRIPELSAVPAGQEEAFTQALRYMDLEAGSPVQGKPVQVVFLGSCTNSRLSDLREAAELLKGKKVASGVKMLVVPGSQEVKRAAEEEGLARIFTEAGAQWREPGCSMCLAMNTDRLDPGEYALSTSNRNFEGRQGPGGRTFLGSPLTAAATAITGVVTDPREVMS
jgi:3-isopropylmalate/(R)-2-methylmalate dehydratase large subunit